MKLKELYHDKELQSAWSDFIKAHLDSEVLKRVYAGKDIAGYKEAREIISQSFAKLNELFTEKRKPRDPTRSV